MTYYSITKNSISALVTAMNDIGIPVHNLIAVIHDGSNYIAIYWR